MVLLRSLRCEVSTEISCDTKFSFLALLDLRNSCDVIDISSDSGRLRLPLPMISKALLPWRTQWFLAACNLDSPWSFLSVHDARTNTWKLNGPRVVELYSSATSMETEEVRYAKLIREVHELGLFKWLLTVVFHEGWGFAIKGVYMLRVLEPDGKATRKLGSLTRLQPARTLMDDLDVSARVAESLETLKWDLSLLNLKMKLLNSPTARPLFWITAEASSKHSSCIFERVSWLTLTCVRR